MTRLVAAVSAVVGLALVVAPRRVAQAIGQRPTTEIVRLGRVLGARQLLEVAALLATPAARRPVAAVEGLHAASMVAAALRWPGARRAAASSGTLAAVLCVLTARGGRGRP